MCRKIELEGIENCRDLGGIPCAGDKRIRKGLLLRSAHLHGASEQDIQVLTGTYRLNRIIDLRTAAERQQKPDPAIDGVEYIELPIFEEAVGGITREEGGSTQLTVPNMEQLYRAMVTEEACRVALSKVLIGIFSHDFEQGGILWHCTAGKDRCGLVSALVLAALGASEEDIMEDYLISNETCEKEAEKLCHYVLSSGGTAAEAEAVRAVFLAKESYLGAAFDAIREQFGGMNDFLLRRLHISEKLRTGFENTIWENR